MPSNTPVLDSITHAHHVLAESLHRDRPETVAADYVRTLLSQMLRPGFSIADLFYEETLPLEACSGEFLGHVIAHAGDITEFALLHQRAYWAGVDLERSIEVAVLLRLITPVDRERVRTWIAEVLWEGVTAEGVCVYAFDEATFEDALVALVSAWMVLFSLRDNDGALERYDEYCTGIATADSTVPGRPV